MKIRRNFEDVSRPAGALEKQLIEAARKGDAPVVDRLIRAGANVLVESEMPLHVAAQRGHLAVVMLLVEEGSLGLSRYQASTFEAERQGHELVANFLKTALKEYQKQSSRPEKKIPSGPAP